MNKRCAYSLPLYNCLQIFDIINISDAVELLLNAIGIMWVISPLQQHSKFLITLILIHFLPLDGVTVLLASINYLSSATANLSGWMIKATVKICTSSG